ncbi:unnamed protein product [Tenebrio molitor]|nr:unnamed protein product [Tenebrio molitor]
MNTASNREDEIKSWLKCALAKENLVDFTVTRTGNSEKGDGYMGEVVFVTVSGLTKNNSSQVYHLVLKCSKRSQALRESVPVKASFENEIYLYMDVLPVFWKFAADKGITDIFDSVPKCYGSFTVEDFEVVVLENLKIKNYYLFDRTKPLPRDHLKLLLEQYGKFHATSAAIKDQQPDTFKRVVEGIQDVWEIFTEKTDATKFFQHPLDEAYELLKSELTPEVADKLKNFKNQISYILKELIYDARHFFVITHGDCWNNNFMFKSEGENGKSLKVAMLDWQTTRVCSPAVDVSYFILACSSEEDLIHCDDLLKIYYNSFSKQLKKLGSDAETILPFPQFLNDFKLFGKYGFMLTALAVKAALSDKDEAPDIAETAISGFEETFSYKIKNQSSLKSRMLYIVKQAAEQGIL